ncbi:Zinc finger protein [Paragonimus heterotremus]|uniref:Zinc finger protein n=1 Tax=Paragonimus heterotremus TaxID=100268 RepID=A0A8J4WL51_9TREM|nr:Zinc finger protein [Paragonimus heterotremus]
MFCHPSPAVCFSLHYPRDQEVDSTTAQFVLFTSMRKLDQAKRSRSGIKLRRGLLIAVTALKAKQLLWERDIQHSTSDIFFTPHSNVPVNVTVSSALSRGDIMDKPVPKVSDRNDEGDHFRNPVWPTHDDDQSLELSALSMCDGSTRRSPLQQAPFPNTDYRLPVNNQLRLASTDSNPFTGSSPIHFPTADYSTTPSCLDQNLVGGQFKRSCLDELLSPGLSDDYDSETNTGTMTSIQPCVSSLKRPCLEIT